MAAGRPLWLPLAGLALLVATSCGLEPKPLLSAHKLIGGTPEELVERLGEPKVNRQERGPHFGALRWADLDGVEVMVVIQSGKGTYASYQFQGMEPFDEGAALARIDVRLPASEPQELGDGGARRWEPCGDFERLTINPGTKLISIGSHPWNASGVDGETSGED